MRMLLLVFLLFVTCLSIPSTIAALDVSDFVIVILSQPNKYHESLAFDLKRDIINQATSSKTKTPVVHLSHVDFPHVGSWTILPMIEHLANIHNEGTTANWFVFLEDRTRLALDNTRKTLSKHNYKKKIFLGYALRDREPTIIHHFAFFENPGAFKYPNAASGFAISATLLHSLVGRWKNQSSLPSSDFHIDSAFELSLFIWNNGKGPPLSHEPHFCLQEAPECATYASPYKSCGELVPKGSIYFAVKTCQKFHKDRVPVVKKTWGRRASHISFFSDAKDETVPSIIVNVTNTERGHCEKMISIFKYINQTTTSQIRWVVLADDDTLLSVHSLRELLTCYDDNDFVALGERYGYNVYSKQGYNYITGGGGTVISRPLLEKIVDSELCKCPSISSPDDMFLGICIARLGDVVIHCPHFHQARPDDYAPEFLQTQHIVSFHKHWMMDPIVVYEKWFGQEGRESQNSNSHNEL